jgi:hypothetical protein
MNSPAFDGFLCDTRTPRPVCADALEVDGSRVCGFQSGGVSAPQPALSMSFEELIEKHPEVLARELTDVQAYSLVYMFVEARKGRVDVDFLAPPTRHIFFGMEPKMVRGVPRKLPDLVTFRGGGGRIRLTPFGERVAACFVSRVRDHQPKLAVAS